MSDPSLAGASGASGASGLSGVAGVSGAPSVSPASGASSRLGEDWPAQTADTIERVVGSIRSKTTAPVEHIARVVVYGLLAAVLGVAALVLLTVAAVRFVDVYLPGAVWSAHLLVGAPLTLVGLFLWSKRGAEGQHR